MTLESVGGVDAARRLQAGETFDVAVLARNAIDGLCASGHLQTATCTDLVVSDVAVAVPAGAPRPDIGSEAALRAAVCAAERVGYSTGPSGQQLMALFERWGIAQSLGPRLVQAPPGVPVAALIARGEVSLGFQQRSEMLGTPGLQVLGTLPAAVQILTTFSGAVVSTSAQAQTAQALLAHWQSPAHAALKQRHGMAPA